jgi:integrase
MKTKHAGIYKRGPGRYRIRATVTNPKTGRIVEADRRIKAKSAEDARRQRDALKDALLADLTQDQPGTRKRLREYAAEWYRAHLPSWKPSTRVEVASVVDGAILPTLGDYFVDAITKADIVAWRDAQPQRPSTVNRRLRILKQILAEAAEELGLPRSPAERVGRMRQAPGGEAYILTAEEARGVLDWLRDSERWHHWYPFALTLALTGLRFGEAAALQWTDLDGEWIHIRRALSRNSVDTPKSRVGTRDVYLPEALARVLEEHRAERRRADARRGRFEEAPWVFRGVRGGLLRTSSFQAPMRAALAANGLGGRRIKAAHVWRGVHNNELRRVASEAVRQSLIGHAGAEVGLRHYTSVQKEEKAAAASQVVRILT